MKRPGNKQLLVIFLIVVVALLIVFGWRRSPYIELVYDKSFEQVSSPFASDFDGFSRLSARLREFGIRSSENFRSLPDVLPELHGKGNVFVLGIAWEDEYSEKDLEALDDFMRSGGGLFVFAEHDNFYGHAERQNKLLKKYGIEIIDARAMAKPGLMQVPEARWPLCTSEFLNIKNIKPFLPAPLKLSADVKPLLSIDDPFFKDESITAAYKEVGAGKLVVLADIEIFWNMSEQTGIRYGNNLEFVVRTIELLAGKTKDHKPVAVKPIDLTGGKKKAVFAQIGGSWFPDGSYNGLDSFAHLLADLGYSVVSTDDKEQYKQADLLVIAIPAEKFEIPEELLEAKHILAISEYRTDIINSTPMFAQQAERIFGKEAVSSNYPLKELVNRLGIEILPGVLLSGSESVQVFGTVRGNNGIFQLRSAGVLRPLKGHEKQFEPILLVDQRINASMVLTPIIEGGDAEKDEHPSRVVALSSRHKRFGPNAWVVAARSGKTVVVADTYPLTNQGMASEGEKLARELIQSFE